MRWKSTDCSHNSLDLFKIYDHIQENNLRLKNDESPILKDFDYNVSNNNKNASHIKTDMYEEISKSYEEMSTGNLNEDNKMKNSEKIKIEEDFNCSNVFDINLIKCNTNYQIYKCIQTLESFIDRANSIEVLDNQKIAIGYNKSNIQTWEFSKNIKKFILSRNLYDSRRIYSHLVYSIKSIIQLRNGLILCGNSKGRIIIYKPFRFGKFYYRPYKTLGCMNDIENKLTKHIGSVNTLIQLRNHLIASVSSDCTIKIWDVNQNYKCVKTIGGLKDEINRNISHTDSINSIIEQENGFLVSGSDDTTIKVWDSLKKYKCIFTLHGHTHCVNSLIKSYNGMIVSGSNDCSIKIWDPNEKYICIKTILGHLSFVNKVIVLNNGWIASGSEDQTIKLWDPDHSYKCVETIEGHEGSINALVQFNDNIIISGSSDKTIRIWEILYDKII